MSAADLFARPGALPLLLLAPALGILLRARERDRARRLSSLAGPRASVAPGPGQGLFLAGVLLALLALPGPAWGDGGRAPSPRGADVVVCLDVSRSMLARDAAPSRLDRAKEAIRALAGAAESGRLGLVAFSGEARLLVPLTRDAQGFAALAAAADPLSVPRGGSDIGAALDEAAAALRDRGDAPAAVFLLTDGEDLGGRAPAAARRLGEGGVPVHCVGYGSPRGAKIALEGEGGGEFLRDRAGREVVSRMDREGLRALASAAGGEFEDGTAAESPLVDLLERRVLPSARRVMEEEERRGRTPRFQWPLALAILLWTLEMCGAWRRTS